MIENKTMATKGFPVIRGNFRTWAKFVVSIGLLAWIINKMPLSSLKNSLTHVHQSSLMLAFFMVNLCMVVSALKWQPLLSVLQIRIPWGRLLAYYYAGLFANNFLPSSIGGDALRIYDVAKESGRTKEAAASVVMERLVASLALGLTAAMAMLFMSQRGSSVVYWWVAGLVTICFALLIFLFCYPFRVEGKIATFLKRLGDYKNYPGILAWVLLLSFLFQGCLVLSNVFTFMALGIHLPIYLHFLYIPVIMAVSMLPLSINGLGVREGMYVLLYGYAGVDGATAILCSLLFFTQVTISSLAGGLIILVRK